ncbi:MAG TPA: aminotransferase class V-fold PLP-dependent enzyme [Cyclobacteriaceae bacterium]
MKINFTPGPSQLYVTVESHVKTAFKTGVPSISHRSKEFEAFYAEAVSGLKELFQIPDNFYIVFTSSATEIWERSIQSLVVNESLHLVNGAFSKKYYEIAQQLGRRPTLIEVGDGNGFQNINLPNINPELIALTHNETSTGVSLSTDFIHSFRDKFPDSLISVDAVSSLPFPKFDFTKIDMLYFSVQKGFGLPAGLGVWIVNEKCAAKADFILSRGHSVGSYHSLPSLIGMTTKNQTPETPNVLGIYLLAKVTRDFLYRGLTAIRQETNYKAALLYQALEKLTFAKPFVKDVDSRSKTVIVADTGEHTKQITEALQTKGLYPGDGYGKAKATQLRFANFPAHSKEQYELLVDSLSGLNL